MIDRKALLTALQRWVKRFEDDLRQRCADVPELDQSLRASHADVRRAGRTAETYETWREGQLTQAAVGWVLAGVFVRFLEDNGSLLDHPWIAAPAADPDRRTEAEHVRDAFFRQHPALSDRDYLHHVFTEVGRLPGLADLFDRQHNPLWRAGISGDAAGEFIAFWRRGEHDFADPAAWDTRFLGDLYQDLSESARKQFALLQTPDFIEEFILDRTLEPAIATFGYERVRMIDPTCGSGHFVLGGFRRLLRYWEKGHPEMDRRELVKHALEGVAAVVDLNPYAIAVTRFRLLLEAWRACGITRLKEAPNFELNLAVGDSLFHGPDPGEIVSSRILQMRIETANSTYSVESPEAVASVLGQKYHAVVGNPPYTTEKDKARSEAYRRQFHSCSGQYSLGVPFMERFFDLAIRGTSKQPSGYVGMITANSFMKREFGKKLIEEFIPRWDITHVIDTSGAYIPGHGTPTVVIFGKNQLPTTDFIRTVLGIRGEPVIPDEPARGLVWQSIRQQVDRPGTSSEWTSAADSPRSEFSRHPWSLGGGGQRELRDVIELSSCGILEDEVETICSVSYTRLDEAYLVSSAVLNRQAVPRENQIEFVSGDNVRNWTILKPTVAGYPYDVQLNPMPPGPDRGIHRFLWPFREDLWRRRELNGDHRELRRTWWEWSRFLTHRFLEPLSITFAEITTHNNFVFDNNRRVFSQTAPVIKPKINYSIDNCVKLVGLLNSSTGCFWMKQVCFPKGGSGIGRGIQSESWEGRFAFDGTKVRRFPLVQNDRRPQQIPTALVKYSAALQSLSPATALSTWPGPATCAVDDLRESLSSARDLSARHRRKLIAWQEELDWQVYETYGLVDPADGVSLPEGEAADAVYDFGLALGERAFEIALARRVAAGETQTTWFERHGSTPITEPPPHWPAAYRELVLRRLRRIADDLNVRLIEQPEYKRRWNTEPWDAQQTRALRLWLLRRLETAFHGGERLLDPVPADADAATRARADAAGAVPPAVRAAFPAAREPRLASTRQLADALTHDPAFLAVAALFRGGREDFDLPRLVRELVEEESVPFLPAQRYKDPGLRKRAQWERTWDLQREEDRLDALPADAPVPRPPKPEIPVPPKYGSGDFRRPSYWRLRGKLDVPKERWILYPGAERPADAASPVIAWAGWDHREQAQALAAHYTERKDQDGWPPERLSPLLAGLRDLVPWLKQWHNEIDTSYSLRLGDFYEGFVRDETHALGLSEAEVEAVRMGNVA